MTDFVLFERKLKIQNPFAVRTRLAPIAGHELQLFGRSDGRYVHLEKNGNVAVAIGGGIDEPGFRKRLSGLLCAPEIGAGDLLQFAEVMKAEFSTDFAIVIGVEKSRSILVFGDVFGAVPIFKADCNINTVISTNADLIGQNLACEYDPISYRDMILTNRICFPHTAYAGVSQCDPTAAIMVSGDGAEQIDVRFCPLDARPEELVAVVAAGLVDAIRNRIEGRSALVALSGGLDSRILLAISKRYCETSAFSITQKPSRDATLASLAARAREVSHECFTVTPLDYKGKSDVMVAFCGSQNMWRHAHFLPLEQFLSSQSGTLLGGYGCNTNFGNYGSVDTIRNRITNSGLPTEPKECLIARWDAHDRHIRTRFGIESRRLAPAWPCTHKVAFAHFQTTRRLVPTLEPLMTPPAAFAAKAMKPAMRPDVAAGLFRRFCPDERDIAVTAPHHPLGSNPSDDPSAGQPDHGWPSKAKLFAPVDGGSSHHLPWLIPSHEYTLQFMNIDSFWRRATGIVPADASRSDT